MKAKELIEKEIELGKSVDTPCSDAYISGLEEAKNIIVSIAAREKEKRTVWVLEVCNNDMEHFEYGGVFVERSDAIFYLTECCEYKLSNAMKCIFSDQYGREYRLSEKPVGSYNKK